MQVYLEITVACTKHQYVVTYMTMLYCKEIETEHEKTIISFNSVLISSVKNMYISQLTCLVIYLYIYKPIFIWDYYDIFQL